MNDTVPDFAGGEMDKADTRPGWLRADYEEGLVSVVVPTFNRAELIVETLASLEAQTWRRLEIVVVDDGSTDDTLERLRARPAPSKGRLLHVLTQPNAGVGAARNTGTRTARGEFIVYLDSDDLLFPEALARYVEALRTHQAGYCFSPIDVIDETGRPVNNTDAQRFHPNPAEANFLFECFWLVHGACYRREVVNAAGPWSTRLMKNEDTEWLWRVKTVAGRGYHLNEVQGGYRYHSRDQLHVGNEGLHFFENRVPTIEVFIDWLRETGRLDREMRLRVARQCRCMATRLVVAGRSEAGRRSFRLVGELCQGLWHPLRLSPIAGCIGAPRVLKFISQVRYRWWRWRHSTSSQGAKLSPKARPELLFISPLFPDAEGIGPSRRAAAVIGELERGHRVTLLVVSSRAHSASLPVAADYLGGRWSQVPFVPDRRWRRWESIAQRWPGMHVRWRKWPIDWNELSRARLKQMRGAHDGQRFDVVHVFRLVAAPYGLELRKNQAATTRYQLDLDDIESVNNGRLAALMRAKGEHKGAAIHENLAHAYTWAEHRLLRCFDRVFVCSETDRQRLQSTYPDVRVLPNVVAPSACAVEERGGREGRFRWLFVGSLGYYPNKDAVIWFCREVLPQLRAVRECMLIVGGRGMPEDLRQVIEATEGARASGEFTTVAEGFARGDALVVPLRAGGGTRIKILEAFAHGVPVVSTTIGIEGIEALPERDYLLADTAEEFVLQCTRLIDDPALCARLAGNARRLQVERYSPDALKTVFFQG